jgi:O-antigen ligase
MWRTKSGSGSRCSKTLRLPSKTATRSGVYLVMATAGANGAILALPTLAAQVGLIVGAALSIASVMLARAGRVLNPAWVIVGPMYLVGPVGLLLLQAETGFSSLAVLGLAPAPFALAALFTGSKTRSRLILMTPLVFLLVLAGTSLLWSEDAAYGVEKLILWIATGLVPITFLLVLVPRAPRISWGLIAVAALLYSLGLIVFGVASPLYPGRVSLFDANPIWAARAVFVGALVVLFGPFQPIARLLMLPVMVAAGLSTVSLGPALGLVVGTWAGVAETLRCADRSDRRVAAGWALLLAGTGLVLVAIVGVGLGTGTSALSTVINDPNVASRATFLDASISLFVKSPVLGIGLGGFAATGLDPYPHNLVAEIGLELGSIGFLALLVWLGLALRGAARSPLLVALVVATATYSLFSGNIAGNTEFWVFSGVAVAMLPIGTRGQEVPRDGQASDHR